MMWVCFGDLRCEMSLQIKKVVEDKPEFLATLADPTELRRKKITNVRETFAKAGVDRILRNLFGDAFNGNAGS